LGVAAYKQKGQKLLPDLHWWYFKQQVELRILSSEDLDKDPVLQDQLLDIFLKAFTNLYVGKEKELNICWNEWGNLQNWLKKQVENLYSDKRHVYFVHYNALKPQAFAAFEPQENDVYYLAQFAVLPDVQRRQIGSRILSHAELQLRPSKVWGVMRRMNNTASLFYKSRGATENNTLMHANYDPNLYVALEYDFEGGPAPI